MRLNQAQTVVDTTPSPFSGSAFYNVTVIGSTPDGPQDFVPISPATTNRAVQFRHCFAGDVFNSVVVSTGAETGIEVQTDIQQNCPGAGAARETITNHVNSGLVNLICSTLDDSTGTPSSLENTVVANGDTLSVTLGGHPTSSLNAVNPSTFDLVDDDTTFNPTGNAQGKLDVTLKSSLIDPRTVSGLGRPNGGCAPPRGTGLDSSATFRGAFAASVQLWTTGWTALSVGGLLAN